MAETNTKPDAAQALADMTKERDDALAAGKTAEEAHTAALDALTKERDEALASAKTATDALDKATKAAAKKPASRSDKAKAPRKVGPINRGKDDAGADKPNPTGAELLELIKDADEVEIAFSDGTQEIAGIAPILPGDDLTIAGGRLKLNTPDITVHGPAYGAGTATLRGYGLILDGKLVAYADRGGDLQIVPNTTYQLAGDVIF